MENHHTALDSLSRRKMLVAILDIPPVLLGLDSLAHAPAIEVLLPKTKITTLDASVLRTYQQEETAFWQEYYSNHGQLLVEKAHWWIEHLKEQVPLARGKQVQALVTLQTHYHQFLLNVAREQCDDRASLFHADQAVLLAEAISEGVPEQGNDLLASSLLRRALAYFEQGDLTRAVSESDRARFHAQNARLQVKGAVLRNAGNIRAYLASATKSETERKYALTLLDEAERLLRAGNLEEDEHFLRANSSDYHIKRIDALLVSPSTKDHTEAEDEIRRAKRQTDPTMQRRLILINIFEVQWLLHQGEYEEATLLAQKALLDSKQIQSRCNREMIEDIYQQLLGTSYKESAQVKKLGWLLSTW